MAFRWMSGLINHLYLQFRFLNFRFDRHGKRPSLEPHSGIFTSRLSQSGTYSLLSTWRSYSFFGVWFRLRLPLLEDLHRFREVLPGDLL